MGECNTILSAYTLYRPLEQYCTNPLECDGKFEIFLASMKSHQVLKLNNFQLATRESFLIMLNVLYSFPDQYLANLITC